MCLVCFINAEESRSNLAAIRPDDEEGEDVEDDQQNGNSNVLCGDCAPITASPLPNQAIHYFAIGSMTNVTSMALRELSPISSKPAMLKGHRMLFRGKGGMATAEKEGCYSLISTDAKEYPFDCLHGVLHLLTAAHMKVLDDFEGGYRRVACTVHLYDGSEVTAYVYQMDRSQWGGGGRNATQEQQQHELPSERYLDIIAKGCEAHGVDAAWVEFVRRHPCIPRKHPRDFSAFRMNELHIPIISWDEILKHDGMHLMDYFQDEEGTSSSIRSSDAAPSPPPPAPSSSPSSPSARRPFPLWIVINNKVLEFKGDITSFFPYGYFVKNHIGGTDFTIKFAKGFYEPKYRLSADVESAHELENEHRCWIEDQFANPPPVLASSKWALVGVIAAPYPSHSSSSTNLQQLNNIPSAQLPTKTTTAATTASATTASPTIAAAAVRASNENLNHRLPNSGASSSGNVKLDLNSPTATSSAPNSGGSDVVGAGVAIVPEQVPVPVRKSRFLSTSASKHVPVSLVQDVCAGFNQFFITGTSSAGDWIVPDGTLAGQTLYLTKTSEDVFDGPVTIRIKHQLLLRSSSSSSAAAAAAAAAAVAEATPNPNTATTTSASALASSASSASSGTVGLRGRRRGDTYVMDVDVCVTAWCWNGRRWYLEYEA